MTVGPVAKLTLRPVNGALPALVLPYNPESVQVTAEAEYKKNKTKDVPGQQFTGRSSKTLSLEARLDARALTRPVPAVVDQVFGWLAPTRTSVLRGVPAPPRLSLSWGAAWFDVALQSASATYTMFASDGTPTRAVLALTLVQVELPLKRQNPTSGSLAGSRSHRVVAGDSLHSIATAEYGDPRHWRDLAQANGLDDPMRLPPGTRLLLPARAELPSQREEPSPWS